jgi:hypothetical protein
MNRATNNEGRPFQTSSIALCFAWQISRGRVGALRRPDNLVVETVALSLRLN